MSWWLKKSWFLLIREFKKSWQVSIFCLVLFLYSSRAGVFAQLGTATMSDYWRGKAAWKLRNTLTLANTGWRYGYGGGSHIEVVDGVWYHFGQKIHWGERCGGDKTNLDKQGIEVRVSHNKGLTWGPPVEIISPGKEWDCMATDGSVYFDRKNKVWHHLFQCLKGVGGWNICYVQHRGVIPSASYQEVYQNPVIVSGDLWHRICDSSKDDCSKVVGGPGRVKDEGTTDIFYYDGAYYYVGFHGFYNPYGFRGIAKTANFSRGSWIAGNPSQGVPSDSIFDPYNAASWREEWQGRGSIGGGAARIIREGNYFYQIIEAADLNLGCVDGQNWDAGIYRTKNLTDKNWEPYPFGNPILYSSKKGEKGRGGKPPACNPAYFKIFRDDATGKIYLHFTLVSENPSYNGIFIYELESTGNLLQNADLWKCRSENWNRISPGKNVTNLVVYRHPDESSDANCYLSANCGSSSCNPGQSVYQDLTLGVLPTRKIRYGGKFCIQAGSGGRANLALFEFDQNGRVLNSHLKAMSLNRNYQQIMDVVTLKAGTKKLRYQIYLDSAHVFKFDEMFLEPFVSIPATPEPTPVPPTPTSRPTPVPPTPTSTPICSFCFSGKPSKSKGNANCDNKIDLLDFALWLGTYRRILNNQPTSKQDKLK